MGWVEKMSTSECTLIVCLFLHDPDRNHSCNRLATGRPFVVELRDCRHPMALTQESLSVLYKPPPEDGSVPVSVINPHTASKAERDELVKAAGTSRKTYRCVVWAARVINHGDLQELEKSFISVELQQATPIRVLHRRPSAVRASYIPDSSALHSVKQRLPLISQFSV
jgi:tRNA U54 and U55 pseudouridine synthase Pus10